MAHSAVSRGWDKYFIVGLGLDSRPADGGGNWREETITEFRIDEYSMHSGVLGRERTGTVYSGHYWFHVLANEYRLGSRSLILIHDGPVAIGSSDLAEQIEHRRIRLHLGNLAQATVDGDIPGDLASYLFVVSNPPTIASLECPLQGAIFTVADLANYGVGNLSTVWAKLPQCERIAIPNRAEIGYDNRHADTNADTLGAWFRQYTEVVQHGKLGRIGLTYASQAGNAYRAGRASPDVQPTTDPDTARLERNWYVAGRQEALYHGKYAGPCFFLDVQSMFPAIAVAMPFPTRLHEILFRPLPKTVLRHAETYWTAAECYLDTDQPDYPCRRDDGVSYPVGRFHAYLCGEELRHALASDRVVSIEKALLYHRGPVMERYATDMLRLRSRYKESGEALKEAITKAITNGIWGKFGQLARLWLDAPEQITDQRYGGYIGLNLATGRQTQYRVIDWQVHRLVESELAKGTFTPIAAAATSYGRSLLGKIMAVAGPGNVLYVAVDGLIVTECGYNNLKVCLANGPNDYGNLRVVERAGECNILASGIYRIGKKTVAAGYQADNGKRFTGFWSLTSRKDSRHWNNTPETRATHSTYGRTVADLLDRGKWPETGQWLKPIRLDEQPHQAGYLFRTGT